MNFRPIADEAVTSARIRAMVASITASRNRAARSSSVIARAAGGSQACPPTRSPAMDERCRQPRSDGGQSGAPQAAGGVIRLELRQELQVETLDQLFRHGAGFDHP